MEDSIVNIRTNKTLYVPTFAPEKGVEFPWKWFEDNPDSKPICRLNIFKGSNLETSRQYAAEFISGKINGVTSIVTYLYHMLGTIQETLVTNWKSYGITLGKGSTISPLSFLSIEKTEIELPSIQVGAERIGPEFDHVIMLAIVGAYRVAVTHENNRKTISDRLTQIIIQHRPTTSQNNQMLNDLSAHGEILSGCTGVEMMLAALDMFFTKFPQHPLANLRIGTIVLRYLGCSALLDLNHFRSLLSYAKSSKVLQWVFISNVGQEIDIMFRDKKDEITQDDSYFPYLIGLRLSQKSPYAAASAPTFHCLVHIVGSLMGTPRSYNALMLETGAPHLLAVNAAIIYLGNKRILGLAPTYMPEPQATLYREAQEKQLCLDLGLDMDSELDKLPETPLEWYGHYQDQNFVFTEKDKAELKNAIGVLRNVRERTVGMWVRDSFLTLLTFTSDDK